MSDRQFQVIVGIAFEDTQEELDYCRDGLRRYFVEGHCPRGFLQAVLRNDLYDAACRADGDNVLALRQYAQFLHNYCPRSAYGSQKKMDAWADKGGIEGGALS